LDAFGLSVDDGGAIVEILEALLEATIYFLKNRERSQKDWVINMD
jgi:hypothetical protein